MRRLRAQHGFTVLESMVAMTVLLVGLGSGLKLLDSAAGVSGASRAREQATSLARELVETARSVSYEKLSPTGTAALVQAANSDLTDASAGIPGWNVRRRGVTYTVAVGACAIDHPVDGIGVHDAATFCASGAGKASASRCQQLLGTNGSIAGTPAASTAGADAGDCGVDLNFDGNVDRLSAAAATCSVACTPTTPADTTPADVKRVVVLVRWDRGPGTRWVSQSATVPFPGNGAAPAITGPTGPATITGGTSATYTLTTDREAAAIEWAVDGVAVAGGSGSGTSWSLAWALGNVGTTAPNAGEVLDGVRTVAARAFDADGTSGQQRAVTVTVNRRAPYALRGIAAGREPTGVLVEWQASAEGDVIGYRVFRQTGAGPVQTVCALTTATACRDTAPPTADTAYWAVALDRDAAGAERTGDAPATKPVVRATNTPPAPPTQVKAVRTATGYQLTWVSSTGDPDPGDSVTFYRIYRDGQATGDRIDRTLNGSATSWFDGNSGTRTRQYWVSAVDSQLGESTLAKAG